MEEELASGDHRSKLKLGCAVEVVAKLGFTIDLDYIGRCTENVVRIEPQH